MLTRDDATSCVLEAKDDRHETRLHLVENGVVRAWWYRDHLTGAWHVAGQQSAIDADKLRAWLNSAVAKEPEPTICRPDLAWSCTIRVGAV